MTSFTRLKHQVYRATRHIVPRLLPARAAQTQPARDARLRHYQDQMRAGRAVQRGFLPRDLPAVQGWEMATAFEPAYDVAGDFYDAYRLGRGSHLGVTVADVCDKGVGAAMFMVLVRSLLRGAALASPFDRPALVRPAAPGAVQPFWAAPRAAMHVVQTTNDYLTRHHLDQAYFATLFYALTDVRTGRVSYVNCGHNPAVVCDANGSQTWLPPTGPALGLDAAAHFEVGTVTMPPGSLLLAYTDGIPEAKGAGGFFGEGRLRRELSAGPSARDVVDRLTGAVAAHRGASLPSDDLTVLGLRRSELTGPATPCR